MSWPSLSEPQRLEARTAHFRRLRALYRGERLDAPFYLWGYRGAGAADPYVEPNLWLGQCLDDLDAHADLLLDGRTFRPLVIEFGLYGVHFVDRVFGATVYDLKDDFKPNWQVRPLDASVGSLRRPDLENDPTWAMARHMADAFVDADVSVPLFGLPTIASALNIAINLYGQEILIAMLVEPQAAHHDLAVINEVLCDMHRWYLRNLPLEQLQPVIAWQRTQPPGYGQLCGCSTHLLSAEQYAEFIAPLDQALLEVYPHGGMIHLCGAHVQHNPVWNDMNALHAVQVNDRAADDLGLYLRDLRKDQVVYTNAYEDMPVARILKASDGGHRTVIVADPEPSEVLS